MLEARCLPTVISGCSGGAVIAAFVCTRTDDELRAALWTIPSASHNLHVDSLPELLRIVTDECGTDWRA